MKEKRLRSLVALGVLPLAIACGSTTEGPGKPTPGPGDTPGAAGGSTTPNGSGGGGSVTPGAGGSGAGELMPRGPCAPGVPVTSQIPMLLNRQYQNVVRDILGVTAIDNAPV